MALETSALFTELHTARFWIDLVQIIGINILLSGDNAVVIALASRSLPDHQRRMAVLGGSAAAVVLRGSRTVVVHDGVDGPRFDAILGESSGLVFSPDGSRLAYVGRQGAEFVFMADGKELLRVPAARHPRLGSNSAESIPQFTDNGRHVYFPLYTEPVPGTTSGYI